MELLRRSRDKLSAVLGISIVFLLSALVLPTIAASPSARSNSSVLSASAILGMTHLVGTQPSTTLKSEPTESAGGIQSATVTTPTRDLFVFESLNSEAAQGRQFVYPIFYGNVGNSIASNVALTETLPPGVVYVSSSGCAVITPTIVGNSVVWSLGPLAPGLSNGFINVVVSVTNATPAGTVLTNVVQINTSDPDVNLADNIFTRTTTVVTPAVDLQVFKGVSGPQGAPGGSIQYNIHYANVGTDSASNVVLTDVLPTSVAYESYSAFGVTATVAGSMIVFTRTSPLANNSGDSISVRVRVPAAVSVGTLLTNVVSIGSSSIDANPADNVFTHTSSVVSPTYDVSIFKSVSGGSGFVGAPITFQVSFANSSNYTVTNVVLTDTLLPGLSFLSWSGTLNNPSSIDLTTIVTPVMNGNQITWTLGSLVQGGSGSINVVALIDPSVSPGAALTNTAGITTTSAEFFLLNNTTSASFSATKFCGPDAFGYTCRDNTMAAGPVFNWIDATTGAETGIKSDDEHFGPYPLGFDFLFYGKAYSDTYLSPNGLVVFTLNSTFNNNRIPSLGSPDNFAAPMWDDLFVCGSSKMYTQQGGAAPNRYFVVEWHDVTRFADAASHLTFEAILRENGVIEYQYKSLTGTLNSATVGIENISGTIGTQYLFNQPGLINGRAVAFIPPGIHYNYGLFLPLVRK